MEEEKVGELHAGGASAGRLHCTQRLWARIEYDGSGFFGFQVQAHERTVQQELERALKTVTGVGARVTGAGRTDRGVHAEGQFIAFETEWQHTWSELQRALNAVLAPDVAVLEMGLAAEGFHPRFSARSRTYRYSVLNQMWRSPLARRAAWHVLQPLDLDRMARATKCLLGTHDFGAFGRPVGSENTVRTVMRAEWRQRQPFLTFDIEADAFLNRMVRSLVGGLVLVGRKQMAVEEFEECLRQGSRARGQIKLVAPAHGLCLIRVDYPVQFFKGVVQ